MGHDRWIVVDADNAWVDEMEDDKVVAVVVEMGRYRQDVADEDIELDDG